MTLAYRRGGIEYVIEYKARGDWDPEKHPRDSKGRFIETGAEIRLIGVGAGKVTKILGADRIQVQVHADRSLRNVDKDSVVVVARPDGSAPTADPKLIQAAEQHGAVKPDTPSGEVEWEPTGKGQFGGENLKAAGPGWRAVVHETANGYRWSTYVKGAANHGYTKTSDEAIEAVRADLRKNQQGPAPRVAPDSPLPAAPKADEPAAPKDLGDAPDWRDVLTVQKDDDGNWEVRHTASGKLVTGGALAPKTRGAAETIAERLMDIRNKKTGDRVDWSESDPGKLVNAALSAGYIDVLKDVVDNHVDSGPLKSVDELREQMRAAAQQTDIAKLAERLAADADSPKLLLSPGGQIGLAHRPKTRGKNGKPESWEVFDARTGLTLGPLGTDIPGGKNGALAFAHRLETELIGEDGKPLDWAAPDIKNRIKKWKAKNGESLPQAIRRIREDHDESPEKWVAPTVKTPDQEDPDDATDAGTDERSGGDADGLRGDRARPLPEAPAEEVPGDPRGRSGTVLRGVRGGDRPAGDGSGGGDRGTDAGGRAVPGDGEAAGERPAGRRSRRAAADAPDGGRTTRRRARRPVGGDGGRPDPLAEPRPGRRTGRGVTADAPRFRPEGMGDLAPSGEKARVIANMEALRTLRTLQAENRPATAEEQTVLARWGGWGAIPDVFDESPDKAEKFAAERAELKRILSPKEYNAARRNTINAHYTDPAIAQAMWDGMEKLGFTGGRVLEPGSGAGTFIGLRPEGADMVGVELDPITAGISKYLYPDANIINQSFARTRTPKGAFDAAIGNVPFGKIALSDPKYNKGKHSIHNHFIIKSLEMTRPGGVVAVLTSRHTLDADGEAGQAARAEMAALGDFIGAVRLPTGSHRRASGTDVVIDMLVFRRREDPPPPPTAPKKPPKKAGPDAQAVYERAREMHRAEVDRYRREREAERAMLDKKWAETVEIDVPSDTEEGTTAKVTISRYFADNPDMVLGEVRATRGQHAKDELGVRSATRGDALGDEVAAAMDRLAASAKRRDLLATQRNPDDEPLPEIMNAGAAHQEGHLEEGTEVFTRVITHTADGKEMDKPRTETTTFTVVRNGVTVPHFVSKADAEELRELVGLRDVAAALLAAEAESSVDSDEIKELRAELNRRYDAYVSAPVGTGKNKKARGPINRQTVTYGSKVTDKDTIDPDTGDVIPAGTEVETTTVRTPPQGKFRRTRKSALVYALEKYNATTGEATKASIFTKRTIAPREPREDADNPVDALAITMDTHGEVKLSAVADLLGVTEPEARARLGTLVFDDPTDDAPDRLTPAAEYLSGNVRRKLYEARQNMMEGSAGSADRFAPNIAALEAVVPKDLQPEDIKARLGVPWVGANDVQDFLRQTLETDNVTVKKLGNDWTIEGHSGPLGTTQWGTEKADALKLAELALQGKRPKVMKKVENDDGTTREVPDREGTADAQAKMDDLNDRFQAWLWEDPDRSERLVFLYNDTYNSLVLRQYDTEGDREMPGLAEKFTLRAHQHAAINRIVAEQTTLLAHEVGAGKTLEMIGGAMELRRLGLARKPSIVVPNHMLEQFSREFLEAYPDANILVATEDQMQGDQRREFVARCATGDWDAVIITHSAFGRIPMSVEAQEAYIDREMQIHREEADAKRADVGESTKTEKQKEKSLKQIETQLAKMEERLVARMESQKDDGVTFEESGIDYVMVDEAHLFKNLLTPSNVDNVSVAGSQRSSDLHMKLDYLRHNSETGRVATFATATPVSNSMAEMYTMMRYLRPDLLEGQNVRTFDDWAAMYGRMVTDVEITPGGTFKMKSRFAEFVNTPELLRVFHTFADVKTAADLKLPTPKVRGGKPTTISVDRTDEQAAYINTLGERTDALQGVRRPKKGEDNHLKINTDGRKAALDLRLVDMETTSNPKLDAAAKNIADIYEANKDRVYMVEGSMDKDPETYHLIQGTGTPHATTGALQIVFSDLGTPGGKRKRYKFDVNGEPVLDANDEHEFTMEDSTWNAYDELRDKLVAQGVPRDKIAFIHEAKNDAEKARMFERARTGQIAVLIGSTAKMGVGTNVQNRAIALHHLDCPWRPTDLVQRNGRIERQGNQHEEIDIFQYVVKDTFDAKAWDTVTKKAQFIGQVMTGTLDQRDIEDIGTSAQTLAEVKAIAANNPHLSEQIRNSARLSGLQRQSTMHTSAQQALRANKTKYEQQIADGNEMLRQLDAALARRRDVSGDNFRMSVVTDMYARDHQGKLASSPFATRKDANTALAATLTTILNNSYQAYYAKDIGEIGGFTVRYDPRTNPKTGEREALISLVGVPGSSTVITRENLETPNAITVRLENRLGEIEGTRAKTVESIERATRNIPIVEAQIGKPFVKADELVYVERRDRVLDDIMNLYGDREDREFDEKLAAFDAQLAALDAGWKANDKPPAASPAVPVIPDADDDVALPDMARGAAADAVEAPRSTVRTSGPRNGEATSPATAGPDVFPPREEPTTPAPARGATEGGSGGGTGSSSGGSAGRTPTSSSVDRPGDAPAPIEPGPAPVRADDGPPPNPLAEFTPAEQAHIRNIIEENAYQYAGGHFGGTSSVARYLAEGRLLQTYTDRYGLQPVWTAVQRYLELHPEARTRSREAALALQIERTEHGLDLNEQAGIALNNNDFTEALRLVDAMEAHDASFFRGEGLTFDEVREMIREKQRAAEETLDAPAEPGGEAVTRPQPDTTQRSDAAANLAELVDGVTPEQADEFLTSVASHALRFSEVVQQADANTRAQFTGSQQVDDAIVESLFERGGGDLFTAATDVDERAKKIRTLIAEHMWDTRRATRDASRPDTTPEPAVSPEPSPEPPPGSQAPEAPAAAPSKPRSTPRAPAQRNTLPLDLDGPPAPEPRKVQENDRVRIPAGARSEERNIAYTKPFVMKIDRVTRVLGDRDMVSLGGTVLNDDGTRPARPARRHVVVRRDAVEFLDQPADSTPANAPAAPEALTPDAPDAPELVEDVPAVYEDGAVAGQLGIDVDELRVGQGELSLGMAAPSPKPKPAPAAPAAPEQVPGQLGFGEDEPEPATPAQPDAAPTAATRPYEERWNTNDTYHSAYIVNVEPGDTIFTEDRDGGVRLPSKFGGSLPARSRHERTVARVGAPNGFGGRVIQFTDGTEAQTYDDYNRVFATARMNTPPAPVTPEPASELETPSAPEPPPERAAPPAPETPSELARPDETAVDTYRAATGGAADAIARAGDDATANNVRWAADRLLDAWRYDTPAEMAPAAAALSALLADAKRTHKDKPEVQAWISVAQLAWTGEALELPAGPPEKPPTGPERPGAVFDPDAPDEAIYGVRGRKGRPRVPIYQGAPKGRPPLYTYQRRNILAYRFDTEHTSEEVRAAARALRYYEPLTAEQAGALADALRRRADDDGDRRKARSARTAAARLDIVAGSLTAGYGRPTSGIDAVDHFAAEVQPGTRVTLGQVGGKGAVTGTVESKRVRFAGRVVELTLRDDATGERTVRQVLKGTPLREVDGDAPRVPADPDPEPLEVTGPVRGRLVEVGTGDTVAIPDGDRVVQGTVTDATALPDGQVLVTVTDDETGQSTPVVAPDDHPAWQLPAPVTVPAPLPGGDEQFVPARAIKVGDVIWPAGDETRAFAVEEIREEGGLLVFVGHDDEDEEVETPAPVTGQVFLGQRLRDAAENIAPPASPEVDGRPDTVTRSTIRLGDTVRYRTVLGQDIVGLVTETWDEPGEDDNGDQIDGTGVTLLLPGDDMAVTVNLYGNDTVDLLDRTDTAAAPAVIERTERERKVAKAAKWLRQVHGETQYAVANVVQGKLSSEASRAALTPEQVAQKILADLDSPYSDISRRLNNLRAGIATLAAERSSFPDVRDASRASLAVDGLLLDIQLREVRALADSLGQAPDQASMRRMLDAIAANPEPRPTPLYRTEAETLVRAMQGWQTEGFDWSDPQIVDTADMPEDPGGDIAERISRFRRALPENMADFGKVRMRKMSYPKITVEDLAAGRIPPPTTEVVFTNDKADDGGPGAVTLRNLEVVKAAGRALADEIDRRVAELAPEAGAEVIARLDADIEEARAAAEGALRRARAISAAVELDAARALGFDTKADWTADFLKRFYSGVNDPEGERAARRAWEDAVDKAERDRGVDIDGATARQVALHKERGALLKAQKDAHRQAALELLAKVRRMGASDDTQIGYVNGDLTSITSGAMLDAMRWAEQHFPTDWLHAAAQQRIVLMPTSRGIHRARGKTGLPEIRLSADLNGEKVTGAGEHGRVAVHELGHGMEDVVPGLKALEAAYLWQRTTDEGTQIGRRTRTGKNALKQLADEKKEALARGNDFPQPYSGREYYGGSHELFTTGVESLFAGSEYLDPDFRAWILGVLATAGNPMPPRTPDPEPAPDPEPDPLAGIDLETISDERLADLFAQHIDDAAVADRIEAEMNRRDAVDADPPPLSETEQQIETLLGRGYSYRDTYAEAHDLSPDELGRQERNAAVDAERQPGESRTDAVRRMYDDWVYTEWLEAEQATRGNMLSRAGVAAGVDPRSLFSGPPQVARKYASEELKRWWDAGNRRKTYTEFLADTLGRDSDVRAARTSRTSGNGRDFGL